jgi:hypothetical protein
MYTGASYQREFTLNFTYLSDFFKLERESKGRSFAQLGLKSDVSVKLITNGFWDDKSKTYAVDVELALVLDEPKEFEQLLMIFLSYSNTSVDHWYPQEWVLYPFYDLYFSLHLSWRSEFQSVSLQPKKDLHYPLLVAAYQVTFFILQLPFERRKKLDLFCLGFLLLNLHNFLNCVNNIELFKILPELPVLYLGEVKKILDYEIHELSCVLLHNFTFLKFVQDSQTADKSLFMALVFLDLRDNRSKMRVQSWFFDIHGEDSIQRIP